jgi:exodeoxyribonuclease VII small subunit
LISSNQNNFIQQTMAQSDKSKSLTEMLAELEKISRYFEQETIDIDECIKMYEAGVKLAAEIKDQLTTYELRITKIKQKYETKISDE